MTTFDWRGGNGAFGTARLWSPRGVPGAGDTARIASGDVVAAGRSVGATVDLGGTDSGAAPAMELRNASVSALTMPDDLPAGPYPGYGQEYAASEYGTVNVRGHGSIGHIGIGNVSGLDRAPLPSGHGDLFAPDILTVNLQGRATLDTSFDVREGSTLTVNGGAGSSLQAGNSTIEGGKVVINAALAGQGAINMTSGIVTHEGFADAGTLELGGSVGAGTTIDITIGNLVIDKPLGFAGTLDTQDNPAASPYVDPGVGPQSVLLRGLAASSYGFDDATHTMTLYDGDAVLDTVRFSANATSASFQPGTQFNTGNPIGVYQTSQGVRLAGVEAYPASGDTGIPLHTATA